MARQTSDLLHRGILPNDDLVKAISMRTHYLIHRRRPSQVADLAAGVDAV